jgi:hypothetical protein
MADEISSRELVRAVGAEFDRRAWSDPDDLALAITQAAIAAGGLDAEVASELATPSFLEANGITPGQVCAVLRSIFEGRVLVEKDHSGPTFIDQSITIGNNNTISGPINAGGNQVVLTNNSPISEVLSALSGFVGTAMKSGFSSSEIELIDHVAEAQGISGEELEAAVRSGIEAAAPEQGQLAKFRDAVMQSAVSGVAVHAIIAAAGALL